MTGSHEVEGSNPSRSTKFFNGLAHHVFFTSALCDLVCDVTPERGRTRYSKTPPALRRRSTW
jgi:hypothetical protein